MDSGNGTDSSCLQWRYKGGCPSERSGTGSTEPGHQILTWSYQAIMSPGMVGCKQCRSLALCRYEWRLFLGTKGFVVMLT